MRITAHFNVSIDHVTILVAMDAARATRVDGVVGPKRTAALN